MKITQNGVWAHILFTLVLLVAVPARGLGQDKAAEDAFRRIEESIESAKTVRVKSRTGSVQEKTSPPELKVLERWVGTWSEDFYSRKAQWTPADVNTPGRRTSWTWILDGRYLQEVVQDPDGTQMLGLWTYDSRRREYRAWYFQSAGGVSEFVFDWEEKTQTFHGRASLPDPAFATVTEQRFIDKDHYEWTMAVRDAEGKLCLDLGGKSERRKIDPIEIKTGPADVKKEPALKPLSHLEGLWNVERLYKAAEWTPEEKRFAVTETWLWVLGGRFLRSRVTSPPGEPEAFSMLTYDTALKRYRSWFFSADGIVREELSGEWAEESRSFTWRHPPLEGGFIGKGWDRFLNEHTHEGAFVWTDSSGKIQFDLRWKRGRPGR